MASPGNPHCANCIGTLSFPIITARCYASAVTAMACVRPSVCLSSQVGVLLKRLNVGSHKQHHTIAQRL